MVLSSSTHWNLILTIKTAFTSHRQPPWYTQTLFASFYGIRSSFMLSSCLKLYFFSWFLGFEGVLKHRGNLFFLIMVKLLTVTAWCTHKQHSSQKDFLSHNPIKTWQQLCKDLLLWLQRTQNEHHNWFHLINKHFISKKTHQQEVIHLSLRSLSVHSANIIHKWAKHLCT